MTLHREGAATITLTLLFCALLNAAIYYGIPELPWALYVSGTLSAVLLIIVLQFFRNPSVKTPIGENSIIAPADGKVVVIEEVVESEYFKAPRRQVSIFMSPFNVHVNRNPMSGSMRYVKYHPGKYLVAWHPKSSTENERTTLVIRSPKGVEVLFRQIAGALARRICWYVKEGDQVKQGEEFGFIKFGSRIDLFLPLDAKILVNLGDKTTGGETIIAELA
jgi:phosphatidylserine decarboxylase